MKKKMTTIVSALLTFIMLIGLIPQTAFTVSATEISVHGELEEVSDAMTDNQKEEVPSVTVYLSVSHDNDFYKCTESSSVMALKEVTIPYFDLGIYGLQDYYFNSEDYEEGAAGSGTAETAYGKITAMHLHIWITEVFYCGISPEEAGQGYLYEENLLGTDTMTISGSSGSSFMNYFWGYDCNLNYYLNYEYPLASSGWGATAEQILLEDGDVWTIGHFTDWSFYSDTASGFNYLKAGEIIGKTTATKGDQITLTAYRAGADFSGNYTTAHTPLSNEPEVFYTSVDTLASEDVSTWTSLGNADANGSITVDTTNMTAGDYLFCIEGQYGAEYEDAIVSTPGGIILTVEEKQEPAVEYDNEITVNVAPSAASVTFYTGENAENVLPASQVEDKGIVDRYHQYVLKVDDGMYSYRAAEGETDLGGMAFEAPIDEEIMSDGNTSGKGQTITLVRTNWYTTNAAITAVGDYTLRLLPGNFSEAVNGTPYMDENNRVITPAMVLARGNAMIYQAVIDINGELAESYAVSPIVNIIFSDTVTATQNKTFSLTSIVNHMITAPKDAKVQMFNQVRNFNVEEIPVKSSAENENGTVTHTFATPGGNNLTYRVSMNDKITRAGYMGRNAENLTFTFEETEDPSTTENKMDNTAMQGRIESSTLLNVNAQNNLKMAIGDTYRLRAYRGAWQIINTDTANIMIEPDFNYNIISGGEHITLTPATNRCTGNAGAGNASNWMDIQAVSEGTAILEVSYDAIMIGGEGTSYDGLYGATDSQRKSLVVINVGDVGNTLTVTADGASHVWDTEFDTLYFTDETGTFAFSAVLGKEVPEKVELSTDNGTTWKTVDGSDGKYVAEGLIGGNNILKVTKDEKTEYQVIRAAKVTYIVSNKTRMEEAVIKGDTLEVVFKGFYTPLSKFSGVYNPGFAAPNHTVAYTLPEGVTATASGGQYNFITNNKYQLTFDTFGDFNLTNGHIYHTNMGSAPGEHRKLTDDGIGSNFNASNGNWERSIFPDLSFHVIEMPIIPVTLDISEENVSVVLTNEAGETLTEKNGVYNLEYGTFNYVITKEGYVTERGSFSVGSSDEESKTVTIQMRKVEGAIWDGLTLTPVTPNEDGVYEISTGAELAWFAQTGTKNDSSANAILTADISLGGFEWIPISNSQGYKGTFDGNGHYVTDLYINSTENNVALFGYVSTDAVIKNLGVSGEVTTTGRYAAGIATAKAASVKFTIENCHSNVNVTAERYAGGIIAAQSANQKVINCYNTGNVTFTRSSASSLFGGGISCPSSDSQKVVIENCYNTGKITGTGKAGSVVYLKSAAYGENVKNSYGLFGTCSTETVVGTDVKATELKTLAPTLGDAYSYNPTSYNNGYPILTWEVDRVLPIVKEEALVAITEYKSTDDYRDAEKAELEAILEIAKTAIDEAESFEVIEKAVAAAKAELDKLKTDNQLTKEELEIIKTDAEKAQAAAEAAKAEAQAAKAEAQAAKAEAQAAKAEAQAAKAEALVAKETAKAEAEKAAQAQAEVEAAKTETERLAAQAAAEKAAAEAARAEAQAAKAEAQAAKAEAQAARAEAEEERKAAQAARAEAQAAQAAAEAARAEAQAAQAAVEKALKEAEAAKALETAKNMAKKELASYKNIDEYLEEEQKELVTIIESANEAIDKAETVEVVNEAVAGAKEAMDAVKTAEELKLPYLDVDKDDWFYDAVEYNYFAETMNGLDETYFGPDVPLTRAQFALILYRIEGEPKSDAENPFEDIIGNEWYGPAVIWAVDKEIVTGYGNGEFGHEDKITREQISVMMYRYAEYLEKDTDTKAEYDQFTDAADVSEFASEAMKWVTGMEFIKGKGNGTLIDPQGNTTRAEAAAIIMRFMNAYAE